MLRVEKELYNNLDLRQKAIGNWKKVQIMLVLHRLTSSKLQEEEETKDLKISMTK